MKQFNIFTEAAVGAVFLKKVFLKLSKIHRKTPASKSLFNKIAGLRPVILLEKKVLSCEFCEILKIPFLQNTSGRLLLFLLWLLNYVVKIDTKFYILKILIFLLSSDRTQFCNFWGQTRLTNLFWITCYLYSRFLYICLGKQDVWAWLILRHMKMKQKTLTRICA